MAGFYALSAIPARYALERGAWQEAAELAVPTTGTPFTIAISHFARALGAARSGRPSAAAPDVSRLATLRDQLKNQDAYWAEQVDIQWRVAGAWVAFAEGRREEAIEAMRSAAAIEDATDKAAVTPGPLAPARELLGEMLLEAGQPKDALQAFEASIAKEPNRLRGAFGAARAAEAAGDAAGARRYYQRTLEIAAAADSQRTELQRARSYLAANR
jgi:tetratricopeptide (TPR) repeat protein